MNIYIRTQNKLRLICNPSFEIYDGAILDLNSKVVLGEYANNERCLEILDEIQELLTPHLEPLIVEEKKGEEINFDFVNQPSGAIYSGTATITEHQTVVYQMPKE